MATPITSLSFSWRPQMLTPSTELHEAGIQFHHAAQFIAALGQSLLLPQKDDSHTNLGWSESRQALVGHWIADRVRLGLDYANFALFLEDRQERLLETFSLSGKSKEDVWVWLKKALQSREFDVKQLFPIDHYELPEHSLDEDGALFADIPKQLRNELQRYRQNAASALESIREQYEDRATAVRTWPHHFDTATLLELAHDQYEQLTASIGIGLAIPDSVADSFYYYVSPWKRDEEWPLHKLPKLTHGQWRTDGFTGAVLPFEDLVEEARMGNQQEQVGAFLQEAVEALLKTFDQK